MSKPPKAARRDLQLADDWQWLQATPQGQRIIADIMTWGEVYTQIEESDPIKLGMAVGANNFAKKIAYYLGLKPEHFPAKAWEDTDNVYKMETFLQSVSG